MIDLHCHILPGLDDGATDLSVALEMARAFASDGVRVVAATPHIFPGLYNNTGAAIQRAASELKLALENNAIPLDLAVGADNHMTSDAVAKISSGQLLTLAGSRYLLVEPPHHVAPQRLDRFLFELLAAGFVPVLTHPERLRWIADKYTDLIRLARAGVWMQITAGSLAGVFGANAKYWAERMLDEGLVHILATDAHDVRRRRPDLGRGKELAARRLGQMEAHHLVFTRPLGVLDDVAPWDLPLPPGLGSISEVKNGKAPWSAAGVGWGSSVPPQCPDADGLRGFAGRLRRFVAG